MSLSRPDSMYDKLRGKYPNIFKQGLPYGIECDSGWGGILEWLCEQLSAEDLPENFSVVQVKNKFGSLRVYADGETARCEELIGIAECASEFTCEVCGTTLKTKMRQDGGWLQVRCDTCQDRNR